MALNTCVTCKGLKNETVNIDFRWRQFCRTSNHDRKWYRRYYPLLAYSLPQNMQRYDNYLEMTVIYLWVILQSRANKSNEQWYHKDNCRSCTFKCSITRGGIYFIVLTKVLIKITSIPLLGQNKRKNRRGDSPTDTPAETPEPSRKLVTSE